MGGHITVNVSWNNNAVEARALGDSTVNFTWFHVSRRQATSNRSKPIHVFAARFGGAIIVFAPEMCGYRNFESASRPRPLRILNCTACRRAFCQWMNSCRRISGSYMKRSPLTRRLWSGHGGDTLCRPTVSNFMAAYAGKEIGDKTTDGPATARGLVSSR